MASRNRRFSLVTLAVEKNASLIIFLVRLSPVLPFGVCNYVFGITKVSFYTYWVATTAGLIPCTVAYTYLGSLMRDLTEIYAEDESADSSNQTLYVSLALTFTLVVIGIITAVTKRTLDKTMKEQAEAQLDSADEEGVSTEMSGEVVEKQELIKNEEKYDV
eukprot:TRINITY_DN28263_c0_g1_i1.p1 TRINITY_DN28263_c0_g1~~TRINITY_DN28263_c0_g1_i1.p1  ORF type:complete len:161 (+),score=34.38 TRINITY_DN28263_c0_g1_i1:1-483(+)